METDKTRLALLEKTIPKIEEYMKEGTQGRINNAAVLARIDDYMKRCDARSEDAEKRIRSLERTRYFSSGIVACLSFFIGGIFEVFKR